MKMKTTSILFFALILITFVRGDDQKLVFDKNTIQEYFKDYFQFWNYSAKLLLNVTNENIQFVLDIPDEAQSEDGLLALEKNVTRKYLKEYISTHPSQFSLSEAQNMLNILTKLGKESENQLKEVYDKFINDNSIEASLSDEQIVDLLMILVDKVYEISQSQKKQDTLVINTEVEEKIEGAEGVTIPSEQEQIDEVAAQQVILESEVVNPVQPTTVDDIPKDKIRITEEEKAEEKADEKADEKAELAKEKAEELAKDAKENELSEGPKVEESAEEKEKQNE